MRLLELAMHGIVRLDAETGECLDVHPVLGRLLGEGREALVARTLEEIDATLRGEHGSDVTRSSPSDDLPRARNGHSRPDGEQRQSGRVRTTAPLDLTDGVARPPGELRPVTGTGHTAAEETARMRCARGLNRTLLALLGEIRHRELERRRLQRIGTLLHACTTFDDAYRVIADAAGRLFGGQAGGLAMLLPPGRRMRTVARWGDTEAIAAEFADDDCWALRNGRPHVVVDRRGARACGHIVGGAMPGTLCVALDMRGESLGLLSVLGPIRNAQRAAMTQQLAISFGDVIRASLANLCTLEELRAQACLDTLTGLYNRRYLDEALARELPRWSRRPFPMCVAMFDVDRFKSINDSFGHDAGDALLRELGQLLRGAIRRSDIACRYGGDEFVIVFPDASLSHARQRAREICAMAESIGFRPEGRPRQGITLSAGVAEVRKESSTPTMLLRAADRALYASKRAGRGDVGAAS